MAASTTRAASPGRRTSPVSADKKKSENAGVQPAPELAQRATAREQ